MTESKRAGHLPALSEHAVLRYFIFAILYVAQGIPEGMTIFGIPAWMAVNGKTAAEIGGYTARVRVARTRLTNIECRRPWVRDEDVVASGVRGRAEQAAYASQPLPHETLTIDLRAPALSSCRALAIPI